MHQQLKQITCTKVAIKSFIIFGMASMLPKCCMCCIKKHNTKTFNFIIDDFQVQVIITREL